MVILPVPLFLSSTLRASDSLCRFSRSIPTPRSPHCALPSLSCVNLNTLLLISCVVSSPSSPSPSRSCADPDASSGAGAFSCDSSPAGVPSPDPEEPSFFLSSADPDPNTDPDEVPAPNANEDALAGGAPNENGSALTGPLLLAASSLSVVRGGLPKPKPTGFPMLPAFAVPNPLKTEGFPGEADPNENPLPAFSLSFSGVVVPVPAEGVAAPKGVDAPEPELEKVKGFEGFLSSLPFSFSSSASLEESAAKGFEPNVEPLPKMEEEDEEAPKMDVDDVEGANKEVEEVDAGGLPPKIEVLDDEGAPNEKEDPAVDAVGPEAEVEPKEKADFGGSEVVEDSAAGLDVPKENGLPSDDPLLLLSILGTKPPPVGRDAVLEAAGGLKPL